MNEPELLSMLRVDFGLGSCMFQPPLPPLPPPATMCLLLLSHELFTSRVTRCW